MKAHFVLRVKKKKIKKKKMIILIYVIPTLSHKIATLYLTITTLFFLIATFNNNCEFLAHIGNLMSHKCDFISYNLTFILN